MRYDNIVDLVSQVILGNLCQICLKGNKKRGGGQEGYTAVVVVSENLQ